MEMQDTKVKRSSFKLGWSLLLFVAFIQAFSALMLWISSGPAVFEADTGMAWSELSSIPRGSHAVFDEAAKFSRNNPCYWTTVFGNHIFCFLRWTTWGLVHIVDPSGKHGSRNDLTGQHG